MKDTSYRVCNGCHNCGMVFVKGDWDEGSTLFCTHRAPPRPICGSVAMDENFGSARPNDSIVEVPEEDRYTERDPFTIAMDAWEEWSKDRKVEESGMCDSWESKKVVR